MNQKGVKFLIDVGVGKKVEDWFLRNGYDIRGVRDINPKMEDDADEKVKIIEKVLTEHSDRLVNNFCVFQNGRLRIRK